MDGPNDKLNGDTDTLTICEALTMVHANECYPTIY
jgi:hypothetical protein